MRNIAILFVLAFTMTPALANDQRWLVFRRDGQGRIAKESTEIWIGNRPTVGEQPGGQKGNLPVGCEVRLLQPGQDPRQVEYSATGLTAKKDQPKPSPSPEEIAEQKANEKIESLLVDDRISDAKWLKVLRLKYSRSAKADALKQIEQAP